MDIYVQEGNIENKLHGKNFIHTDTSGWFNDTIIKADYSIKSSTVDLVDRVGDPLPGVYQYFKALHATIGDDRWWMESIEGENECGDPCSLVNENIPSDINVDNLYGNVIAKELFKIARGKAKLANGIFPLSEHQNETFAIWLQENIKILQELYVYRGGSFNNITIALQESLKSLLADFSEQGQVMATIDCNATRQEFSKFHHKMCDGLVAPLAFSAGWMLLLLASLLMINGAMVRSIWLSLRHHVDLVAIYIKLERNRQWIIEKRAADHATGKLAHY